VHFLLANTFERLAKLSLKNPVIRKGNRNAS
jgi:hypothetical protein